MKWYFCIYELWQRSGFGKCKSRVNSLVRIWHFSILRKCCKCAFSTGSFKIDTQREILFSNVLVRSKHVKLYFHRTYGRLNCFICTCWAANFKLYSYDTSYRGCMWTLTLHTHSTLKQALKECVSILYCSLKFLTSSYLQYALSSNLKNS